MKQLSSQPAPQDVPDRCRGNHGERGSISPLIAVYVLIALIATLLVASAADLYLAHKRLFAVADAAALAASGTATVVPGASGDGAPKTKLDAKRARQAASAHLHHFDGDYQLVDLAVAGDRVTLSVSVEWTNPFTGTLVTPSEALQVTVSSRAVLERAVGD